MTLVLREQYDKHWLTPQRPPLLKEPLHGHPSPVNTVTYKQKKPTLPLILFL